MIRKEVIGNCTLYLGDCREILPDIGPVDVAIADPPYGVTSLEWDRIVAGWHRLLNTNSLWCFGSMRFFLEYPFDGWTYAQDIVWKKHTGSGFQNDRFRRIHELAVHFYKGKWEDVFKSPVFTYDAVKKTIRRKQKPTHMRGKNEVFYSSVDGGPRLMHSVIDARSCHGSALHPTQKPLAILKPLIEYSAPEGGLVLDPMMGSGSTGVVCAMTGRRFIGIEVNEEYFDIAVNRIRHAFALPSELKPGQPTFL